MSSTPKHLAMYEAFGWAAPQFAHVGLLVNDKNQKLSKRDGSIDISSYRDEQGVFPESLANFVALLGWSHTERSDVMSMQNLIDKVRYTITSAATCLTAHKATMKYTRGDTRVSFQKLWYLQKMHAQRYAAETQESGPIDPEHDLMKLAVRPILKLIRREASFSPQNLWLERNFPEEHAKEQYLYSILLSDVHNYKTPSDFIARNKYFFGSPDPVTLAANIPPLTTATPGQKPTETALIHIKYIYSRLSKVSEADWEPQTLKSVILEIVQLGFPKDGAESSHEDIGDSQNKTWMVMVHKYIRWALLGGMPGPDTGTLFKLLGRDETLVRLEAAILAIEK